MSNANNHPVTHPWPIAQSGAHHPDLVLGGAYEEELPHFCRNDIFPLVTLLESVQPRQERDKLVGADKLDVTRETFALTTPS